MNLKITNLIGIVNRIRPEVRFLLVLLVVALLYEYPSVLLKHPQSVHHWRQSDCLSTTLNYYQNGMHFFTPQTHNLTSNGNTTGYNATSEIPLEYYSVALLYNVFGVHDWIYRLLNTLIFLTGLFYLFKTAMLWLQNYFWAACLTLFLFTSPVLVYYGNNFLTDTSAFALALVAWYHFSKFYVLGSQRSYYVAMLFFLLAGACKITALISFIAVAIVFVAELIGLVTFKGNRKLFEKPLLQFLAMLFVVVVIASWALYAHYYNQLHRTFYFSTQTFPLWSLDGPGIRAVLKNMRELWFNQYYHPAAIYVLGALLLVNLWLIQRVEKLLRAMLLLVLLGVVAYGVLWFWTFQDHDYYTINLYMLVVFTLLVFAWLAKTVWPARFHSTTLKAIFLLFLVFNVYHAKTQMRARYHGWWNDEHSVYKYYETITPYLHSIGISPLDTVVCLPDMSHFTLYLMNLRGWTECLGNNKDSASIATSIAHGANYLIVNGNEITSRSYIQPFLYHPLGQYGPIRIFKLDNDTVKTIAKEPASSISIIETIRCGAENVTPDQKYFIVDSSSIRPDHAETRTNEKTYSGRYAIKLTRDHPFGMTSRLRNIKQGDHITAAVFRYSVKGNGKLVVACNKTDELYINTPTRTEKMPNGWERLIVETYINFTPNDGELAVYLWNDGKDPVYFDDLLITRERDGK